MKSYVRYSSTSPVVLINFSSVPLLTTKPLQLSGLSAFIFCMYVCVIDKRFTHVVTYLYSRNTNAKPCWFFFAPNVRKEVDWSDKTIQRLAAVKITDLCQHKFSPLDLLTLREDRRNTLLGFLPNFSSSCRSFSRAPACCSSWKRRSSASRRLRALSTASDIDSDCWRHLCVHTASPVLLSLA